MKTVRIYDYEDYKPETCHTGGDYGFWTIYRRTTGDNFEISYHTTSDFEYCPYCGTFGHCECDGEYETVKMDELNKILASFEESENKWVEIEYE